MAHTFFTLKETHYDLPFNQFSALNPTPEEFIEWNIRQVRRSIATDDAASAFVYAAELVNWSHVARNSEACMTRDCFRGDCSNCTDTAANCCECNCHHSDYGN